MVEPDFENIIRKYRSLISPGPDSKSSQRSREVPIDDNREGLKDELEISTDSFSGSNFSDNFIGDDRFLRAPVAAPEQNKNPDFALENLVFNSLFASVDFNDDFNQLNKLQHSFKENEEAFDVATVDLANRIYDREVDLRKQYNPGLGIYPSQALYSPSGSKFKNRGSNEKKTDKEMSSEKLDIGKPSSVEENQVVYPKEIYDFISRMNEKEKSRTTKDEKKPEEGTEKQK
jgi:hypothetical protein